VITGQVRPVATAETTSHKKDLPLPGVGAEQANSGASVKAPRPTTVRMAASATDLARLIDKGKLRDQVGKLGERALGVFEGRPVGNRRHRRRIDEQQPGRQIETRSGNDLAARAERRRRDDSGRFGKAPACVPFEDQLRDVGWRFDRLPLLGAHVPAFEGGGAIHKLAQIAGADLA